MSVDGLLGDLVHSLGKSLHIGGVDARDAHPAILGHVAAWEAARRKKGHRVVRTERVDGESKRE